MKRFLKLSCLFLLVSCGEPAVADQSESALPPQIVPEMIKTGPLQWRDLGQEIACTGRATIPPSDFISIHSLISGQVSGLNILPGDYVRKGQALLSIRNPELIQMQREWLENKARLQGAEQSLSRQEVLAEGEATTAELLDLARNEVALRSATDVGLSQELRQYGVNVDRLEKEQKFQTAVTVFAPRTGYVYEVLTNQGKRISPQDELLQISVTEHLHLDLSIPSEAAAAIKKGQRVRYRLPFADSQGEAVVSKINPQVDPETSMLSIHCELAEKRPEGLMPGLFVNATISTEGQRLPGLPLSATVQEGEQYYGFRMDGDQPVKTLLRQVKKIGDFVSFTTDITTGDWVIDGAYYLE